MKTLIAMLLAIAALIEVKTALVPAWEPKSSFQVVYDETSGYFKERPYPALKDYYTDFHCRRLTRIAYELCVKPHLIPAEEEIQVSFRDELFRHEDWGYLLAGTVYTRPHRRAEWEFNPDGTFSYVFDCAKAPCVPPGMKVVMHNGGVLRWDPGGVELFSPTLMSGDTPFVHGYDYLKALAGRHTLNGAALEYLLSDPGMIPREWDDRKILFLGTIYTAQDGKLHSSLMFKDNGRWIASINPLDHEYAVDTVYAAVLA